MCGLAVALPAADVETVFAVIVGNARVTDSLGNVRSVGPNQTLRSSTNIPAVVNETNDKDRADISSNQPSTAEMQKAQDQAADAAKKGNGQGDADKKKGDKSEEVISTLTNVALSPKTHTSEKASPSGGAPI